MPGASFKAPAPSSTTSTSTVPSPPLTPADPSERQRSFELERWLDCELGERVRRVFYFPALNHRDLVIRLFNQGGPWWVPADLSRWVPHDPPIAFARRTKL